MVSLSPEILDSPFVSLDQLITSLTYSAQTVDLSQDFSCFLVPYHAFVYPTGVLGAVYGLLMHKTPSRIVYLWSAPGKNLIIPNDNSLSPILGAELGYDTSVFDNLGTGQIVKQDNFCRDDVSWATHVFYARFLPLVQLSPLIIGSECREDENIMTGLMSRLEGLYQDNSTVIVYRGDTQFSLDENNALSMAHTAYTGINKLFYDQCINRGIAPHLLNSSYHHLQQDISDEEVFDGVFATT